MGACSVEDRSVPPGKLARVGETVFGAQDLDATQSQLGAYGQFRFMGEEGRRDLLQALIDTELLAQEAVEHGKEQDPRVEFAVFEEIATVYLSSEIERRVPRSAVANDTAALRAYYDAHPHDFRVPEHRSMEAVSFTTLAEADVAFDRLRRGEVELRDLGELVATVPHPRNDLEYPGFHPFLFAEGLEVGDWLPRPIVLAQTVLVGRLQAVDPEHLEAFEDPSVQERLVEAVRAPKVSAATRELLEELAAEFPYERVEE